MTTNKINYCTWNEAGGSRFEAPPKLKLQLPEHDIIATH